MMRAGWYCALAGGILTKGKSDHDLDLVFVPMDTTKEDVFKLYHVLSYFGMQRIISADLMQKAWRKKGSQDCKFVEWWETKDEKRIDVIIPTRSGKLA